MKKIKEIIKHLEEVYDPEGHCKCEWCARQELSTYLDGLRDSLKLTK